MPTGYTASINENKGTTFAESQGVGEMSAIPIISQLARTASKRDALPSSLANCHFPGLYSIVLDGLEDGLLLRAYIAPPGHLHPWLTESGSPFLWHAHAYDFRSTTVVGHVRNIVVTWEGGDHAVTLHEHLLGKTAAGRTVTPTGITARGWIESVDDCPAGCQYSLHASKVHRVTFEPCPVTGWLVVLIRETRKAERPISAWSTSRLGTLPGAADLYRVMTPAEVDDLCARMVARSRELEAQRRAWIEALHTSVPNPRG